MGACGDWIPLLMTVMMMYVQCPEHMIHFRQNETRDSGQPLFVRPARSVKTPYLRLYLLGSHLDVWEIVELHSSVTNKH